MMRKMLIVALVVFLWTVSASAYTIVMRDGRQVQIPDKFTVTESTLTYEVSSGIQVTLLLSTVDISETEFINGEVAGTFMARAITPPLVAALRRVRSFRAANRTITNESLEKYRLERLKGEREFEEQRKDLGLPSSEERRREVTAIEDRTREQLLNVRAQDETAEAYWRSRASSLRSELAANEAQIEFVRGRLNELPSSHFLGSYTTTFPFPWGLRRNRRVNQFPFPMPNVLVLPSQNMDHDLERTELVSKLNGLQIQRAALMARWRELEEEARRAGAYPGWLRR